MTKTIVSLLSITILSMTILYSVNLANAAEDDVSWGELKCQFDPAACKDKGNG